MNTEIDAFAHMYRFATSRKLVVRCDGENAPTLADAIAIRRRMGDGLRVYILDPIANGSRVIGWADVMEPGPGTCSPAESVYEYSEGEFMTAWAGAFEEADAAARNEARR